ncbi:unnamed protein product [Closterium sp. NIES-54]
MAHSILSVGLVLFLAAVLALSCFSCAQGVRVIANDANKLVAGMRSADDGTPCSLVFKRKVEDCYALSLVRTQKSMDKCKEDLQAQIVQCGGKPVRTEYPLAGGASKPSKSARPSAKK